MVEEASKLLAISYGKMIVSKDKPYIRSLLMRFSTEIVIAMSKEWPIQKHMVILTNGEESLDIAYKAEVIEHMIKTRLSRGISIRILGNLQIRYYEHKPYCKYWRTYMLIYKKGGVSTSSMPGDGSRTVSSFTKSFSNKLRKVLAHSMVMQCMKDLLWIWIIDKSSVMNAVKGGKDVDKYDGLEIAKRKRLRIGSGILVVHLLHTQYVFISRGNPKLSRHIQCALVKTTTTKEMKSVGLEGKDLNNFVSMVKRYNNNQGGDNDANVPKDETEQQLSADEPDRNEQISSALKQVTYNLSTQFPTTPHEDNSSGSKLPLRWSVRFNGNNIINGLNQLVAYNIAVPPLQHYLTSLSVSKRNVFEIDDTND